MHIKIFGFIKVSEKEACAIGSAFWLEFSGLEGASSTPSAAFLQEASRLCRTRHENSLTNVFTDFGLQAPVPISYKAIGLDYLQPVLSVKDFITCLSNEGKLDILFMGHGPAEYEQFWLRYQKLNPNHPIYKTHQHRLAQCLPLFLHCDEGTSVKRRGLMVIQYQCILGRGSSHSKGDMNYIEPSIKTRYLYSCILANEYGGSRQNKPLLELTRHMAEEFRDLFFTGVEIMWGSVEPETLFPVVIGLKGDWGGLSKIGTLNRSYTRDTPTKPHGPGICHLCRAGQKSHQWHKVDYNSMMKARQGVEPPWKHPPPLVQYIPMGHDTSCRFLPAGHISHLPQGCVSRCMCELDCVLSFLSWFLKWYVCISCMSVESP